MPSRIKFERVSYRAALSKNRSSLRTVNKEGPGISHELKSLQASGVGVRGHSLNLGTCVLIPTGEQQT